MLPDYSVNHVPGLYRQIKPGTWVTLGECAHGYSRMI